MQSEIGVIASGEFFDPELVDRASGVSLLRSEYLIRSIGASPTTDGGFEALRDSLERLAASFFPKQVWYRLSDFESRELLTVAGYRSVSLVENPILSPRGARRALEEPDEYEAEAAAVAEVSSRWPNLSLMLSYVGSTDEFRALTHISERRGVARPSGAMIEIPSAMDEHRDLRRAGAAYMVIGLQDLTMNYFGVHRGTSAHDRGDHLTWALVHASGIHATVAGVLLGFAIPVIRDQASGGPSAGPGLAEIFEHRFRPVSAGIAVPVFAFFSAGVTVGGWDGFVSAAMYPVTVGIIVALVLGKPIGILGTTWLLTKVTKASLDRSLSLCRGCSAGVLMRAALERPQPGRWRPR
ncbi:Na+/H+ antiporter NhaA [Paenarthrobacter aurescens]|jgi:hypothetical protein|uniref:Na+/H+ antiporter NhaA n=1 Tax=Paenarthrobacter aurescens TaxID=43663 RepID=UPI0005C1F8AA|nr:Na+/H+ antiporter NhaA [Paenarthrobacter aurescens]